MPGLPDSVKAWIGSLVLSFEKNSLKLLSRILFKPFSDAHAAFIEHIVVYRVGNLGDTVVAMPALYTLRQAFPKAKITLLTSSGRDGLVGAGAVLEPFVPLVDDIVAYLPHELKTPDGVRALKDKITQQGKIKVDLFVDLPVSMETMERALKEMAFARSLGSRFAVGFDIIFPDVFRQPYSAYRSERIPSMPNWMLSIVQRELHKYGSTMNYLNEELAAETLKKKTFWKKLNLSPDKPLLLVNAGAKLAIKQWPKERFAHVLTQVWGRYPGIQIALLGSLDEYDLNESIRLAVAKPYVENLAGKLSLSETALLLHAGDALLTNDTGTMHMAGILNKPLLAIFSGQFPAPLWNPPGEAGPAQVLMREPVPCVACLLETCPLPEQICLTQITPEQVMQVLSPLLDIAVARRVQSAYGNS